MKGKVYKGELNVVSTGMEGTKATISAEKQAKLFELLQAPYANPIGSIVRETSTNAWDAHVEAGHDAPILISLNWEKSSGYFIEFVDEGVGMSPDRIYNVYVNYLESTKEDTNDQSGYFGIGSKSPLSYASEYFLTTVYSNIRYEYLIRKDDDGIPVINLLDESPTGDKNGTTVKIYIDSESDANSFISEIKSQLYFFEHVFFVNNTHLNSQTITNDFKIVKGEYFVCRLVNDKNGKYEIPSNGFSTLHCSIGQVAYPIKEDLITKYLDQLYPTDESDLDFEDEQVVKEFQKNNFEKSKVLEQIKSLKRMGVGIRVPIGDPFIGVIMTREDIKYRKDTIPYLITLIDAAFKEVHNKNVLMNQIIDYHKLLVNDSTKNPGLTYENLTKHGMLCFDANVMKPFSLNTYSFKTAYSEIKTENSKVKLKLNGHYTGELSTVNFVERIRIRVKEWVAARKIVGINSENATKGSKLYDDLEQFVIKKITRGYKLQYVDLLKTRNLKDVDADALRTLGASGSASSTQYTGAVYVLDMDPDEMIKDTGDDINVVIGHHLKYCKFYEELVFNINFKNLYKAVQESYRFTSINRLELVKMSDLRVIEATASTNLEVKNHYTKYNNSIFDTGVKGLYPITSIKEYMQRKGFVLFVRKSTMMEAWSVYKRFIETIGHHESYPMIILWVDQKNEKLVREYGFKMLEDWENDLPTLPRKVMKGMIASYLNYKEKKDLSHLNIEKTRIVYELGYYPEELERLAVSVEWSDLKEWGKVDKVINEILKRPDMKRFKDDYLRIYEDAKKITNAFDPYNVSNIHIFLSLRFGKPMKEIPYAVYRHAIRKLKEKYETTFGN